MYEVELKVPADLDRVRGQLEGLDADRREIVRQVDTYYDAPHREFAETDEALRVREATIEGRTHTELTYKGPLVDDVSKTREEHETRVDDGEELRRILAGIGFEPAATIEKRRETFGLDGYTVTLDTVAEVGEFVEVEREVPESAIDDAREGAIEVLERLDLDADDGIRTSYLGLLLEDE